MKLGDRIKRYEAVTRQYATPGVPLMIRVDGRAFHTFTKGCKKPFDASIMSCMVSAAYRVAQEMPGFKAAYIQSDEATFCITDYDNIKTQGWFDYNISKIVSITASLMSVHFNSIYKDKKLAVFDSRAFSIPKEDVINAFLWRAKDWERNSLQMFARSVFSNKQLHGKKTHDMHEMLHSKRMNWTSDTTRQERNGTFIIKNDWEYDVRYDVQPHYKDIKEAFGNIFDYPEDE